MTLQIEFERKRLHVVIHYLPVRQSGSDGTSTGSRSEQECQSREIRYKDRQHTTGDSDSVEM